MTIVVILILVALAVAGYTTYKKGTPNIDKLRAEAMQALDKIEPAIQEVEEIVKKAEKAIPENKVVKTAAKAVKAGAETVKKAKIKKGSTGSLLLESLESRLDCIIHRLGFAPTIPSARQIVNHGHVLVNKKLVNIASFLCSPNDIISIKEREQSKNLLSTNFNLQQRKRNLIQRRMKRVNLTKSRFRSLLPKHLEINPESLVGKVVSFVKRKDVLVRINELKVVEYYSR
jgi:ribosomal protein S4